MHASASATFRSKAWSRRDPLAPDEERELGEAEQISPPQPSRLDHEASEPLEPVLGQPAWAAHDIAGDIVEHRANGEDDRRSQLGAVFHDPELLEWHPEPHEQDVGPTLVDRVDHRPRR